MTEYDTQVQEIVQLFEITQTELTALRLIQFMPKGERRMLGNIKKLIRLMRSKLQALPMPPMQESHMFTMELMQVMKDQQNGVISRGVAVNRLIKMHVEINAAIYFLDLALPRNGQVVDLPDAMGGDVSTGGER